MLVCDCWFWRNHQEGVTAKELAQITERAKLLRVTLVSDNGDVRIFRVEGGEAPHYATEYPSGGEGGLANCKHLIATRRFIGQTQDIPKTLGVEDSGETDPPAVSTGVSAVG